MSKVVVHDYWRHFTPEAPTINVQTYKNVDTLIDLRDIFVQGARDYYTGIHDANVIQAIGAQRGWLVDWFVAAQPKHGFIVDSDKTTGFTYRSNYDFVGDDCCTYFTHVGAQRSIAGRINIEVEDYYSVGIRIYKTSESSNSRSFVYQAVPYLPNGMAPVFPSWVAIVRWYHLKPRRFNDPLNGNRPTIIVEPELFHSTIFDSVNYQVVDNGQLTSVIEYTWPDNYYSGYIYGTDEVYVQPEGPWPVIVEVDFHNDPVNVQGQFTGVWENNFYTSTDIRLQYGDRWWESGLIQTL